MNNFPEFKMKKVLKRVMYVADLAVRELYAAKLAGRGIRDIYHDVGCKVENYYNHEHDSGSDQKHYCHVKGAEVNALLSIKDPQIAAILNF